MLFRSINHSGVDIEFDGAESVDTRQGDSAGSTEALSRLQEEVGRASSEFSLENLRRPAHRLAQMRALSRFQHGTDAWLDGSKVQGRPPIFTITKDGEQTAQWNPRSGRFAFSKASLPLLDACDAAPRVSLKPGLEWRGDLFSTNVESAEAGIRAGDEILVMQEGRLRSEERRVGKESRSRWSQYH